MQLHQPDLQPVIFCVKSQWLLSLLEKVHLHVTQCILQLCNFLFAQAQLTLELMLERHWLWCFSYHRKYPSMYLLLVYAANLVICGCSVLLQRLQKLFMFLVILADLLPVKLQEFSGGTQIRQSLLDRREWRLKFSNRRSTRIKTAGPVG